MSIRCDVVQAIHHQIDVGVDPTVASLGFMVMALQDVLVQSGRLLSSRVLLPDQLTGDAALMRCIPMFPEIDGLPGAQPQLPSGKAQRHRLGC